MPLSGLAERLVRFAGDRLDRRVSGRGRGIPRIHEAKVCFRFNGGLLGDDTASMSMATSSRVAAATYFGLVSGGNRSRRFETCDGTASEVKALGAVPDSGIIPSWGSRLFVRPRAMGSAAPGARLVWCSMGSPRL